MRYQSYMPYASNKYMYRNPNEYYVKLERNNYNIKVGGTGIVKASPDIAEVLIGVETQNKDLRIAQKENSEITNQVIIALKDLGVQEEDVQTVNYSINKAYDYIDGQRIFKEYNVSNKVRVTVRNIDQIGDIIDSTVENGANFIGNIKFDILDPSPYYDQALTLAVSDAQEKANIIAKRVGVQVNNIPVRIVEEKYETETDFRGPAFRQPSAETPIEAGQFEIKADIVVEFNYWDSTRR